MRILRQLFRPRLMILVGMIALSIMLLLFFIQQAPQDVAKQFASQLEAASENEVDDLIGRLGRLGQAGIPELARNLGSTRRVVVLGVKNVLEEEFQKWTRQEIQKSASSHYFLAKSLAENLDQFGPTARLIAASFAQRILRTFLAVPTHDSIAKRVETIRFCEEILQKTEGERSVAGYPVRLNEMYTTSGSGEPLRSYPPDPYDAQLILAANENHSSMSPGRFRQGTPGRNGPATEFFDPYSSPRAELLYAVHQSRLHSELEQSVPQSGQFPEALEEPMLARLSPLERLAYRNATQNYESPSETFHKSQVSERIASRFLPQAILDGTDRIIEESEERLPQLPAYDSNSPPPGLDDRTTYPKAVVEKTDLGKTPID